MSLFGILESTVKVVAGVTVAIPVSLIVDAVTLPSTAHDSKEPFGRTSEAVSNILENLKNATTSKK